MSSRVAYSDTYFKLPFFLHWAHASGSVGIATSVSALYSFSSRLLVFTSSSGAPSGSWAQRRVTTQLQQQHVTLDSFVSQSVIFLYDEIDILLHIRAPMVARVYQCWINWHLRRVGVITRFELLFTPRFNYLPHCEGVCQIFHEF